MSAERRREAKEARRRLPGRWEWIKGRLDKDDPPADPESRAFWLLVAESTYDDGVGARKVPGWVWNVLFGCWVALGLGTVVAAPRSPWGWVEIAMGCGLIALNVLDPFDGNGAHERLRRKIEAARTDEPTAGSDTSVAPQA